MPHGKSPVASGIKLGPNAESIPALIENVLTHFSQVIYQEIPSEYFSQVARFLHSLAASLTHADTTGHHDSISGHGQLRGVADVSSVPVDLQYSRIPPDQWDGHSGGIKVSQTFNTQGIEQAIGIARTMKGDADQISAKTKGSIISNVQSGYQSPATEHIVSSLNAMAAFSSVSVPDLLEKCVSGLHAILDAAKAGKSGAEEVGGQVLEKRTQLEKDNQKLREQHQPEIPPEEIQAQLSQIVHEKTGFCLTVQEGYKNGCQALITANNTLAMDARRVTFGASGGITGLGNSSGGVEDLNRRAAQGPDTSDNSNQNQGLQSLGDLAQGLGQAGQGMGSQGAGQGGQGLGSLGQGMDPLSGTASNGGTDNSAFDDDPLDKDLHDMANKTGDAHHKGLGGGGGMGGAVSPLSGVPSASGYGGKTATVAPRNYGANPFGTRASGVGTPMMGMGGAGAGGAGAGKSVQGNSYGKNYASSLIKPQSEVEEDLNHKILGQHVVGGNRPLVTTGESANEVNDQQVSA